ncbi:gamma-glutamyltranspeptidase / glutathione hydrolase [Anaerosphaera aminiphila DSM 21120]|uniref:Gamma-glutamyltranspeptidase / glutathione hydrolase n=1 Tax=Anaerosphaera aminiphila DSM 21120 TaxID=1120995 RepID=A0A1M5PL81_9FIRM|nr:gamma-glutamyltransferase family protein [Anaerosphaera aminiphila]SHH02003.1 gamma-glutamyltranspeptidase / glutathione hydrolase [Anaerosphaera aminiphila DSM 21120]
MNFDALKNDYPSRRSLMYSRKGMVCTSQPLAAQAGLDMIKKGGNAVDAAIATAVCMTVLEPTSNGIGGDSFALIWMNGKLHGLNSSGVVPKSLNVDVIENLGYKKIPERGWIPVMVPGAPAAWAELSEKFGKLSLEEVFEPAIQYAEEGYPVSPIISKLWDNSYSEFKNTLKGKNFEPWFEAFTINGRAPAPGEIWKSTKLADTLRKIAKSKSSEFYRGELADKIDTFSKKTGGYIRKSDLENYWCEWVDPIHINYRGYDVWEIPPNGNGIVALMALNILKGFEFTKRDTADTIHKQLEAMKLAFTDGKRYISDIKSMKVTTEQLLSDKYAAERRNLISDTALLPKAGNPQCGDTVYLCTADGEGNMVSFIQSNYMGFGSGIVIPETGISLQNRGYGFTLDKNMENFLEPGKKAFHTIIPGFLSKDNEAIGPFGVMGGFMQPQGHVQVITNTIDFHMNPQEALDAPRWQWIGEKNIQVEQHFSRALIEDLINRGHNISVLPESLTFGRGQIIWRNHEGVLAGATEPRADGVVATW